MNILYHHRTQGAGVEGVHIRELSKALTHMGHRVFLIGAFGPAKEYSFDSAEPEQMDKLPTPGTARPFSARLASSMPEFIFEILEMFYNCFAYFRIRKVAREVGADLIYERYAMYLIAGVLAARASALPIILEMNDSAFVPRVRPLFFVKLSGWFERGILRRASGAIFVSTNFKDTVAAKVEEFPPAAVVPNAADLSVFDPARPARTATRQMLGYSDQLVCGYVGAFVPWHGIDRFVRSLLASQSENRELKFLLVGDGRTYPETQSMISGAGAEDFIYCVGRVAHQKVPDYISAMDFAVLPDSNDYGSPMKVFELMAMGVAVVAPAYPPLAEVIEHGKTGWLFEPGNIEQCVSMCHELAGKRAEVLTVGQNAADFVAMNRQWSHNAEAILNLLERSGHRP